MGANAAFGRLKLNSMAACSPCREEMQRARVGDTQLCVSDEARVRVRIFVVCRSLATSSLSVRSFVARRPALVSRGTQSVLWLGGTPARTIHAPVRACALLHRTVSWGRTTDNGARCAFGRAASRRQSYVEIQGGAGWRYRVGLGGGGSIEAAEQSYNAREQHGLGKHTRALGSKRNARTVHNYPPPVREGGTAPPPLFVSAFASSHPHAYPYPPPVLVRIIIRIFPRATASASAAAASRAR